MNPIVRKFRYGKHTITIEIGVIARQATSSVVVNMDDTSVLVTLVAQKKIKEENNFFPLMVNYQERSYASGKIPGSFFRREGRPSENEILISRLIDRPIRPLFPEGFINELQIIATVISINPQINPDIVSIIGASLVLSLSGVPFKGPIGAARVGYINDKYILNPTCDELKKSSLDMIISGTSNSILMIESKSNILTEEIIFEAILFGHEQQKIVIENINFLKNEFGDEKWDWKPEEKNKNLLDRISDLAEKNINNAYSIFKKKERDLIIDSIKEDVINNLIKEDDSLNAEKITKIILKLEKKIIRKRLLQGKLRIDGRENDMIRALDVRTGVLPRTHGSSLFTRGETQSLSVVTLGTEKDAQIIEEAYREYTDNFIFHYNFPPYSVGEIGLISSPKRREIGHGKLAKNSILPVMPEKSKFPYTIRIVSEITESNGSSSMASVCGASLALMDAGVPIKNSVAGIAMGLIKEKDEFIILSDILGYEDHIGDMDFKIAGTFKGITALQLDLKIDHITEEIINIALNQAKGARIHILKIMNQAINKHRQDISEFAPRIHTINIDPEKIKDVIGKGGFVIRALTEETGTIIEIDDDGTIKIASKNNLQAQKAINRIKDITAKIEVNKIYRGKITRIVDFGAFVTIGIGKEGLVHISQIADRRIENINDYIKLGQIVSVKVLEIDRNGRIRLSIKEAKPSKFYKEMKNKSKKFFHNK